jgi:hypothetical protein
MALILSGGDGGNATITGNSGNLTIANATAILASSATISASGNVTGGNLLSSGGFYYANGTPFSSGAAATSINLQQNYGGF